MISFNQQSTVLSPRPPSKQDTPVQDEREGKLRVTFFGVQTTEEKLKEFMKSWVCNPFSYNLREIDKTN